MNKNFQHNRFWTGVSPWVLVGAVVILLPIFGFMTAENINRQKENSMRLLREKGAALIRSFEAGTRFGMMGGRREGFRLQQLLAETAQQPDIAYLLVTDDTGRILAHSDPSRINLIYGQGLDITRVARSDDLQWRLQTDSDGKQVFEVYRKFTPAIRTRERNPGRSPPDDEPPEHMMMHHWFTRPAPGTKRPAPSDLAIFVGLKMDAVDAARRADHRHTIIMATILLLLGFAGIVVLLFTQSYQATRTSLQRIKAFSDNVVTNMPVGLLATDAHGRIASINPVACSILAISASEAVGRDLHQVVPPQFIEQIANLGARALRVGQESDCTLKDGRAVPLEISVSQSFDDSGEFLGHVLLFKDQREVRELRQAIARNQRLVTVGKLAGGVAHEIRNPLSSIKGFATYFKERYPDVPEDQRIAAIMIQEVERLNKVVGQLLEFSRPIRIEPHAVVIEPFLQDSLKLVEKRAAEHGVALTLDIPEPPPQAFFDPDRINQILLNLYLNAVEAMPSGGTLTVAAAQARDGSGLMIEVRDTGQGIKPEDQVHIFDPYYTTKTGGTGLGLAIVHNIIEAHGGQIRVDSQTGRGTRISIILPQKGRSAAT